MTPFFKKVLHFVLMLGLLLPQPVSLLRPSKETLSSSFLAPFTKIPSNQPVDRETLFRFAQKLNYFQNNPTQDSLKDLKRVLSERRSFVFRMGRNFRKKVERHQQEHQLGYSKSKFRAADIKKGPLVQAILREFSGRAWVEYHAAEETRVILKKDDQKLNKRKGEEITLEKGCWISGTHKKRVFRNLQKRDQWLEIEAQFKKGLEALKLRGDGSLLDGLMEKAPILLSFSADGGFSLGETEQKKRKRLILPVETRKEGAGYDVRMVYEQIGEAENGGVARVSYYLARAEGKVKKNSGLDEEGRLQEARVIQEGRLIHSHDYVRYPDAEKKKESEALEEAFGKAVSALNKQPDAEKKKESEASEKASGKADSALNKQDGFDTLNQFFEDLGEKPLHITLSGQYGSFYTKGAKLRIARSRVPKAYNDRPLPLRIGVKWIPWKVKGEDGEEKLFGGKLQFFTLHGVTLTNLDGERKTYKKGKMIAERLIPKFEDVKQKDRVKRQKKTLQTLREAQLRAHALMRLSWLTRNKRIEESEELVKQIRSWIYEYEKNSLEYAFAFAMHFYLETVLQQHPAVLYKPRGGILKQLNIEDATSQAGRLIPTLKLRSGKFPVRHTDTSRFGNLLRPQEKKSQQQDVDIAEGFVDLKERFHVVMDAYYDRLGILENELGIPSVLQALFNMATHLDHDRGGVLILGTHGEFSKETAKMLQKYFGLKVIDSFHQNLRFNRLQLEADKRKSLSSPQVQLLSRRVRSLSGLILKRDAEVTRSRGYTEYKKKLTGEEPSISGYLKSIPIEDVEKMLASVPPNGIGLSVEKIDDLALIIELQERILDSSSPLGFPADLRQAKLRNISGKPIQVLPGEKLRARAVIEKKEIKATRSGENLVEEPEVPGEEVKELAAPLRPYWEEGGVFHFAKAGLFTRSVKDVLAQIKGVKSYLSQQIKPLGKRKERSSEQNIQLSRFVTLRNYFIALERYLKQHGEAPHVLENLVLGLQGQREDTTSASLAKYKGEYSFSEETILEESFTAEEAMRMFLSLLHLESELMILHSAESAEKRALFLKMVRHALKEPGKMVVVTGKNRETVDELLKAIGQVKQESDETPLVRITSNGEEAIPHVTDLVIGEEHDWDSSKSCVIGCVLEELDSTVMKDVHFDLVFVDETSLISELELLPVAARSNAMVLLADPFEPAIDPEVPFTSSPERRLSFALDAALLLSLDQLPASIVEALNPFYAGNLVATQAERTSSTPALLIQETTSKEIVIEEGLTNPEEAIKALTQVKEWLEKGVPPSEITVLTPSQAQVEAIQSALVKEGVTDVEVSTVSAYSGVNKPYLIVSFVQSNAEQDVGVWQDHSLLVKALTRARLSNKESQLVLFLNLNTFLDSDQYFADHPEVSVSEVFHQLKAYAQSEKERAEKVRATEEEEKRKQLGEQADKAEAERKEQKQTIEELIKEFPSFASSVKKMSENGLREFKRMILLLIDMRNDPVILSEYKEEIDRLLYDYNDAIIKAFFILDYDEESEEFWKKYKEMFLKESDKRREKDTAFQMVYESLSTYLLLFLGEIDKEPIDVEGAFGTITNFDNAMKSYNKQHREALPQALLAIQYRFADKIEEKLPKIQEWMVFSSFDLLQIKEIEVFLYLLRATTPLFDRFDPARYYEVDNLVVGWSIANEWQKRFRELTEKGSELQAVEAFAEKINELFETLRGDFSSRERERAMSQFHSLVEAWDMFTKEHPEIMKNPQVQEKLEEVNSKSNLILLVAYHFSTLLRLVKEEELKESWKKIISSKMKVYERVEAQIRVIQALLQEPIIPKEKFLKELSQLFKYLEVLPESQRQEVRKNYRTLFKEKINEVRTLLLNPEAEIKLLSQGHRVLEIIRDESLMMSVDETRTGLSERFHADFHTLEKDVEYWLKKMEELISFDSLEGVPLSDHEVAFFPCARAEEVYKLIGFLRTMNQIENGKSPASREALRDQFKRKIHIVYGFLIRSASLFEFDFIRSLYDESFEFETYYLSNLTSMWNQGNLLESKMASGLFATKKLIDALQKKDVRETEVVNSSLKRIYGNLSRYDAGDLLSLEDFTRKRAGTILAYLETRDDEEAEEIKRSIQQLIGEEDWLSLDVQDAIAWMQAKLKLFERNASYLAAHQARKALWRLVQMRKARIEKEADFFPNEWTSMEELAQANRIELDNVDAIQKINLVIMKKIKRIYELLAFDFKLDRDLEFLEAIDLLVISQREDTQRDMPIEGDLEVYKDASNMMDKLLEDPENGILNIEYTVERFRELREKHGSFGLEKIMLGQNDLAQSLKEKYRVQLQRHMPEIRKRYLEKFRLSDGTDTRFNKYEQLLAIFRMCGFFDNIDRKQITGYKRPFMDDAPHIAREWIEINKVSKLSSRLNKTAGTFLRKWNPYWKLYQLGEIPPSTLGFILLKVVDLMSVLREMNDEDLEKSKSRIQRFYKRISIVKEDLYKYLDMNYSVEIVYRVHVLLNNPLSSSQDTEMKSHQELWKRSVYFNYWEPQFVDKLKQVGALLQEEEIDWKKVKKLFLEMETTLFEPQEDFPEYPELTQIIKDKIKTIENEIFGVGSSDANELRRVVRVLSYLVKPKEPIEDEDQDPDAITIEDGNYELLEIRDGQIETMVKKEPENYNDEIRNDLERFRSLSKSIEVDSEVKDDVVMELRDLFRKFISIEEDQVEEDLINEIGKELLHSRNDFILVFYLWKPAFDRHEVFKKYRLIYVSTWEEVALSPVKAIFEKSNRMIESAFLKLEDPKSSKEDILAAIKRCNKLSKELISAAISSGQNKNYELFRMVIAYQHWDRLEGVLERIRNFVVFEISNDSDDQFEVETFMGAIIDWEAHLFFDVGGLEVRTNIIKGPEYIRFNVKYELHEMAGREKPLNVDRAYELIEEEIKYLVKTFQGAPLSSHERRRVALRLKSFINTMIVISKLHKANKKTFKPIVNLLSKHKKELVEMLSELGDYMTIHRFNTLLKIEKMGKKEAIDVEGIWKKSITKLYIKPQVQKIFEEIKELLKQKEIGSDRFIELMVKLHDYLVFDPSEAYELTQEEQKMFEGRIDDIRSLVLSIRLSKVRQGKDGRGEQIEAIVEQALFLTRYVPLMMNRPKGEVDSMKPERAEIAITRLEEAIQTGNFKSTHKEYQKMFKLLRELVQKDFSSESQLSDREIHFFPDKKSEIVNLATLLIARYYEPLIEKMNAYDKEKLESLFRDHKDVLSVFVHRGYSLAVALTMVNYFEGFYTSDVDLKKKVVDEIRKEVLDAWEKIRSKTKKPEATQEDEAPPEFKQALLEMTDATRTMINQMFLDLDEYLDSDSLENETKKAKLKTMLKGLNMNYFTGQEDTSGIKGIKELIRRELTERTYKIRLFLNSCTTKEERIPYINLIYIITEDPKIKHLTVFNSDTPVAISI